MSGRVSVERIGRRVWQVIAAALRLLVCLIVSAHLAHAQPASASDRDALVRQVEAAGAKGLPVAPLMDKIREGFAKGYDAKRIELGISQMVQRMETADRISRDVEPGAAAAAREGAIVTLEEALRNGLTSEEIRELHRQAPLQALTSQDLADAAKGLSFIKDARLPVADGIGVMAEAIRQKFRSHEMLDLAREVKRREADYRAGRVTLRALRDAIARGTRPETLLRDSRAVPIERPAATRPTSTTDRPERTTTPVDRPQRPVDRPATPGGERAR